jgi:bacillithiol system protein YtxJ
MPIERFPIAPGARVDETLASPELLVLYKHSPTCGLCDIAIAEVEAFAGANPDVPIWMIDVLSQRPLSRELESMLGVEHESPQVIILRNGTPVWNGSHRRVTKAKLEEAISALPAAS